MYLDKLSIDVVGTETIPPNEAKAADIFARIGYRIEEAVADLADNSIDAKAKNILIRFQRFSEGIHSVIVADDGNGMDEKKLMEAMRFGSEGGKGETALGKYGIGLKSASLSQAQTVTVISKAGKSVTGRRWTMENIRKGWLCERLDVAQCARVLEADYGPVRISKSGTLVIWERLEHLRAGKGTVDRVLEKARKTLSDELGIKFHRLLEREDVKFWIDEVELTDEEPSVAVPVQPMNPFSHGGCGMAGYPSSIQLPLPKQGSAVELKLHIWPPKTKALGYRLGGGKVASRQGFYFYRNDRLIQAGGWNGLQGDDSEPHLSLARIEIDLPPKLESAFKLNIGKSLIDPPAEFLIELDVGGAATAFRKFLKDADTTYRRQKKKESAKFSFTGGGGFSTGVRSKIKAALSEKGLPQPAVVDFEWAKLPADEVVQLDAVGNRILLNKNFKSAIVGQGGNDAAMLKLLVLLLFQSELGKSFLTETSKDRLRRINQALLATIPG